MIGSAFSHAVQSFDDHIHQVIDVDKVTAGVHHKNGFIGRQPMKEGRERPTQISRTIGIGQTERDRIELTQVDVEFPGSFANGITAFAREDGMSESDGLL